MNIDLESYLLVEFGGLTQKHVSATAKVDQKTPDWAKVTMCTCTPPHPSTYFVGEKLSLCFMNIDLESYLLVEFGGLTQKHVSATAKLDQKTPDWAKVTMCTCTPPHPSTYFVGEKLSLCFMNIDLESYLLVEFGGLTQKHVSATAKLDQKTPDWAKVTMCTCTPHTQVHTLLERNCH